MEPVLFYGVPSGCSLASIVALEWLGQPYRLARVEMLEQPWDAAYARVNPKMKTPALLLEDGTPLTESLAILQHIARRADASRRGPRHDADALAETLSYLVTDLFSAFAPLWAAYEKGDEHPDWVPVLRQFGQAAVEREFAYLETRLKGRDWLLGGEQPSVADAYLFAVARWADYHQLFDTAERFPAVARVLGRLRDDPAVRFALAVEQGEDGKGAKGGKGDSACLGHVPLQDALGRAQG
ncbi:glutathione S-transferase N-terminal domain-containing protein [Massilia sp. METH4]|uniref:glutathione S-transferase family protein n=1 Tax=Massilia sp. METH4 TaxID=3123041 RepID=UPI0030D5E66C